MSNNKSIKLKTILMTGGTGLIGKRFIESYKKEYNFIVISRFKQNKNQEKNIQYITWDTFIEKKIEFIEQSDIIINLAGASLLKPLTQKNKETIYTSRIDTTKLLVNAIKQANTKPVSLINASAIGYYSHVDSKKVFTEKAPAGTGFISDLCKDWESESLKTSIRSTQLRIGLVLDAHKGFLNTLLLPFNMFLGGHLGNGNQSCPWIHIKDVVAIIKHIIETENLSGPINLVSPDQCSLKTFCQTLGMLIRRPSWLHPPDFIIKLLFRELAPSLLNTPFIKAEKLINHNYKFIYSDLNEALKEILT
tara:strand:+ start:9886 stop:10803 length:918 start_codon:yes stop_codon:yes gene_type:complete